MSNTIKLKRGSGSDPSASDLSVGELAIRTDLGKIFTKKDNGNVAEISGGGGIDDGDKGDITVSNAGDTWTIDNGVINNAKVASDAAIAGTKISPDFGSQNIATTGTATFGGNATFATDGYLTTTTGITIENSQPGIIFSDTNANPDFILQNRQGSFAIRDITNAANRFLVDMNNGNITATGNMTISGTVDGVDIAARNTLFGGLTSSSGVLTNGVTATTQSAGNNTTRVATTAFVSTAISNLVDSSPSTLNTLNELAAALGDDANFSTTVTNSIATKMPLAGGAFTGDITTRSMTPPSGVTNIDIGSSSLKYRNIFASGNITVDGTVDGRDLATDGTKLDGIESNATADQTASEILTLLKTVDGAGSGLDADTLDGISSASFMRSDANDTTSGSITLSQDGTDVINFSANSTNDNRGIAFNGRTAVSADYNDGWLRLNNGNEFSNGVYTPSQLYTAGVLRADGGVNVDGAYVIDGNGNIVASKVPTLNQNTTGTSGGFTAGNASNLNSGTVPQARLSASTLLTLIKTVDGTGSGLDADLLDGTSSADFYREVSNASATVGPGWVTVAENTSGRRHGEIFVSDSDSGDHAFIRIDWLRSYNDSVFTVINCGGHQNRITGVRVLRDSDITYGNKKLQVYVTVSSTYRVAIKQIQNQSNWTSHTVVTPVVQASISGYSVQGSALESLDTYAFSNNQGIQAGSGGIKSLGNVDITGNITVSGTVDGADVASMNSKLSGIESGATADQSASEILTLLKTVDGSGSGLDADTVDGYNVSTSSSTNTIVARQGNGYIFGNFLNMSGTFSNSPNTSGMANFTGTNGSDTYGRSYSAAAARALLNVENGATADQSASEILTLIKTVDGAGSGLDADTLDGVSSGSFVRSDAADTLSGTYTFSANSTDVINLSANSTSDNRGISFNSRTALSADYNDGYLRLNNSSEFSNGVYTPLVMRADGGFNVDGTMSINGDGNYVKALSTASDYSSLLRSNADDVATHRIQFQNNATDNEDTIASSTGSQGGIEIYNSGAGNDAFMAFHSGSDFALYFGLDADINDIAVGGWSMGANKYRIWHQNNDGSGSGLDSDTVDGVHGSSFLRSDTTDTASGAITFNGDVGFNGGAYAAHIEANSDIAFHSGNWTGNHCKIQQHSSTLYIVGGSGGIIFRESGTDRSRIDDNGHFRPATDSTYDLGLSGTRWRNLYADTLYGDGSNLTGISAGATGGGSDEVFYENDQTVTSNYTITNGKNAMAAGPITINSGVTVTVGSGETLTIV